MKLCNNVKKKIASAFDTKVYACRLHLKIYLRERRKICLVSNWKNVTTVGRGWHACPTIYNKTLVYWHGFLQVKVTDLMTNKILDLTLSLITIVNTKSFSMKLCTISFNALPVILDNISQMSEDIWLTNWKLVIIWSISIRIIMCNSFTWW